MHWVLVHLFLITMAVLVVCSGMLVWGLHDLPLRRRIVGFVAYFSLIAYLFYMIWPTGGVEPPNPPKPPAAPHEIMTCRTTYAYNIPGGGNIIKQNCELVVLEGEKP